MLAAATPRTGHQESNRAGAGGVHELVHCFHFSLPPLFTAFSSSLTCLAVPARNEATAASECAFFSL